MDVITHHAGIKVNPCRRKGPLESIWVVPGTRLVFLHVLSQLHTVIFLNKRRCDIINKSYSALYNKKYVYQKCVFPYAWWRHQMETFLRYWPFVRGIHHASVNSPHKGQWRGALMFSLICTWTNDWVNNRDAGDLRRYWAYYDVTVMDMSHNVCLLLCSCLVCCYQQLWMIHVIIYPYISWNPLTHKPMFSEQTLRYSFLSHFKYVYD